MRRLPSTYNEITGFPPVNQSVNFKITNECQRGVTDLGFSLVDVWGYAFIRG